jgi:Tol biopolymer transport system component
LTHDNDREAINDATLRLSKLHGFVRGTASVREQRDSRPFEVQGLSMNMRTWIRILPSSAILLGCVEAIAPEVPAPPPSLVVRVTTIGPAASLDADGYSLEIDGIGQPISGAAVVNINGLAAGSHSVRLSGVAANCSADANPRSVQITGYGQTVVSMFVVSCLANSGTLEISTTTTGQDLDPDGYRVLVISSAGTVLDIATSANGAASYMVPAGPLTLRIEGVRGNCAIDGGAERQVTIAHATLVAIKFEGRCQGLRLVRFTTVTTGPRLDIDGYQVEMRLNNNLADFFTLPSNGTKESVRLMPGTYSLRMWGVQLNCATPALGSATVAGDVDTEITIEVTCAEPLEFAFAVGLDAASDIKLTNTLRDFIKPIVSAPGRDADPAWSPDGGKLVFTSGPPDNTDIYVVDADGSNRIRLTDHVAREYRPAWSPDGKRIAFVSDRGGDPEIYVMKADGSDQVRITTHSGADTDPAWAPDASRLAFARADPGGPMGIFIINADGSDLRRLTDNPQGDSQPAWAPDGSRIAFSRKGSNFRSDIYLINGDGSSLAAVTQNSQASDADWSPDGKYLAFAQEDVLCEYYYYNCVSQLVIARVGAGPAGVSSLSTTDDAVYNPSWRPRK